MGFVEAVVRVREEVAEREVRGRRRRLERMADIVKCICMCMCIFGY